MTEEEIAAAAAEIARLEELEAIKRHQERTLAAKKRAEEERLKQEAERAEKLAKEEARRAAEEEAARKKQQERYLRKEQARIAREAAEAERAAEQMRARQAEERKKRAAEEAAKQQAFSAPKLGALHLPPVCSTFGKHAYHELTIVQVTPSRRWTCTRLKNPMRLRSTRLLRITQSALPRLSSLRS